MIAGLETPDSGEIWFDERCVFSREKKINLPPEKRGLGFVFQDFAIWPHMTVFENVAFGLRAEKDTKNLQSRVREALRTVHLEDFEARYPPPAFRRTAAARRLRKSHRHKAQLYSL